ncbi:MAG: phosphotriesterase [Saprospiraceae bacterium]|nr:phosphotriesterase [Saprospiraceae bacterium]
MNRYLSIYICTLVSSTLLVGQHSLLNQTEGSIMTITGPIAADSMGLALIHEHVFLDWSGADKLDKGQWNNEDALRIILPYLQGMKENGVRTFLECTPAYLGRNPQLLLEIAKVTGLQILTNTGYYAARKYQHIPQSFYEQTAEEIAEIWINEFNVGIGGGQVRPGFIKIGLDARENLTSNDQKLVLAAAKTHLATGLTIVSHTGTDQTAALQISLLREHGVAPEAFVWTHAQRGTKEGHLNQAREGAWISLDGLGWVHPTNGDSTKLYRYVDMISNLKEAGFLHRTLISHDAGWYTVGDKSQDKYQPYTPIFELLFPILVKRGFSETDINQLLVKNPLEAYIIRVRNYP